MPEDIEDVFDDAGLSLFPSRRADLETGCSCPDWSNPCKHVASVYLLLGEEFDRDPFLVFRLRGLDRERLVNLIAGRAGAGNDAGNDAGEDGSDLDFASQQVLKHSDSESLPADPAEFWGEEDGMEDSIGAAPVPSVSAVLPTRLGSFPFWRGQTAFLPAMEGRGVGVAGPARHVPEKPGAPERAVLGIPFPIDERQEQPLAVCPAKVAADSGRGGPGPATAQAGRWEAADPHIWSTRERLRSQRFEAGGTGNRRLQSRPEPKGPTEPSREEGVPMDRPRRAALYARVPTDDPEDGLSWDNQLSRLREYAEILGVEVYAESMWTSAPPRENGPGSRKC